MTTDFNGDHKLDLAVATWENNVVSLFWGGGDGSFAVPPRFTADPRAKSMAVADINADGIPDLAITGVGGVSNGVHILLGAAGGGYQRASTFLAGSGAAAVALGDVDGDGKPDLAVVGAATSFDTTGSASILLGNGDGTFAQAHVFPLGRQPTAVAIGDLNADHKPDLAVAVSGGVSVLLGNGAGAFLRVMTLSAGNQPSTIGLADFNGDGLLDIAVGNQGSSFVNVLLNRAY